MALAVRELFGNPLGHVGDGFPSEHLVLLSILYIVAITAVFSWLAVGKYQRTTGR